MKLKITKNKKIILGFILAALLIIVAEVLYLFSDPFIEESANQIVNSCKKTGDWRTCYGEVIGEANDKIELSKTLKILEKIKEIDSRTRDCHLIAHWISLSEVKKAPEKWAEIFNYVDQTTCNNGYVHGVMEGRSRIDSTFKVDQEVIIDTCQLIDEKTSKRLEQKEGGSDDACGHIMGHIMLAENNGEIPVTVKVCEGLDKNLRKSCLQGLFMENVTRENLDIHEVARKLKFTEDEANSLKEVCEEFEGEAGESCWRELSHIFTIISRNDPEKSYIYCYSGSNQSFNQECYLHAINLIVLAPDYSIEDLTNTCKPFFGQEQAHEVCISRTISPLINSSVEFTDRAINFCGVIPLEQKSYCYGRIGFLLKPKANLEQRKKLCGKAPEKFFKLCSGSN